MKKTLFSLLASITASGVASAATYFHTDFDEADFASTGMSADTPGSGGGNDFTLNTTTEELDFVTTNADMWGARGGAPIAWVSSPTVAIGETWTVETFLSMEKDGSNNFEVGGVALYGSDGSVPDVGMGLDDWNGWNARLQGFGDNAPNVGSPDLGAATGVFLRTDVTEGGATDTYNFFWKVNAGDAWTQLGGAATNYTSGAPNSRVGLFLKSNPAGGSGEFDFLTITVPDQIPEPSTGLLTGLAALSLAFRRRRK